MSLPNYLARIKSAGLYRFTFDKSQIPSVNAETMRLVVGYSEKGPFNNPIYIDNKQDFINLFGNINKRLEKKGVFFHRMALQALSAGPIIALNLKPFKNADTKANDGSVEQVSYVSFDTCSNPCIDSEFATSKMNVTTLYDRDRFWKIDSEKLATKISDIQNVNGVGEESKYINIAATDVKDFSCSVFIRKCHPTAVKSYNVSIRDWYKNTGEEIPEYLEGHEDDNLKDYFAEVYVFHGKFTDALIGENGVLSRYFKDGALNTGYTNNFGEAADALNALATDENSNCIGVYRGCLLPYFKDQNGNYNSLDVLFNGDRDVHKMIMKLDENIIDDLLSDEHNELTHWGDCTENPGDGWGGSDGTNPDINSALYPVYIEGYTYGTLTKKSTAIDIYKESLNVLTYKGIFEALTNHVDSEFHYIVDTYATPVVNDSAAIAAKNNIAFIAKTKDNCLALMNAPAMAEWQKFANSNPLHGSFTMADLENGKYSYVNPLPSEVDGASYCAFFTPLLFGEGLVRYTVPSAALVSNLFLDKWSTRQPYYIVAGPNYARISYTGMIGPDYNYSRGDLDVLEPMGINAIIYVPRKGTYINSNQTAKQTPVSALSKIHVRELVIYLQNEIESMLQNYQWELNTQALRDRVKTSADAILDRIQNNGGVYAYLNVCDSSNNTPEVIDNEMIILDTSIEPARGAGKMVQRLTIHKTGGISSLTQ